MDVLIRIVIYILIGIVLLAANIWFIRTVRNAFNGGNVVIAPFQVIGQEDKNNVQGTAIASMLQARLSQIQQDMISSQQVLIGTQDSLIRDSSPSMSVSSYSIFPLGTLKSVNIPTDLLKPMEINVEVSGVEVGGVVNWIQQRLVKERTLEFTVYFQEDKAIIAGRLKPFGITNTDSIWLETGSSPDQLTTDLAYTLIKLKLSEDQVSEINALTLVEFQTLLQVLKETAELNKMVELGRPVKDGFQQQLSDIETLTTKMPKWYALIRFVASLAESAENTERALHYYQQLQRLEITERGEVSWVNTKVQELSASLGIELPEDIDEQEIFEDLKFAVNTLNQLFQFNLDVPPIKMLDSDYKNAYWDGTYVNVPPQVKYIPDITYNVVSHVFLDKAGDLSYMNQSGALLESYSDVLTSIIKQASLGQTAQEADWLLAPGFIAWMNGADISNAQDQSPLRSLKAPGTAYDDPNLGKDPQPAHMDNYKNVSYDNGGVHINSGIPNKAFYESAIRIGSESAGEIWVSTLRRVKSDTDFQKFATLTFQTAGELFGQGSEEHISIGEAWKAVGITP